MPKTDRPTPTAPAARLAAVINQTGPIGVDAFMAHALYDPKEGYYVAGKPLGAAGDFTTSPEISQIFGELVGLWLAQSWMDLGSPAPCHLIELGPGQGTLMADILRVGAKVPGFLDAMRVHLVETNTHLRTVQASKLAAYSPQWHAHLSDVPSGPSLIVGNEFLDCMPMRQFVRAEHGWHEKQVGSDAQGHLIFGLGPLLSAAPMSARPGDPIGSVREIAPSLAPFVETIRNRFESHVGRALLIDYCDFTGQPGDTLQALHRHTKCYPLDHVGNADLTAHVDFAALKTLASQATVANSGPVTQAHFLESLGIEARASALIAANPHCANDVQAGVARLIGRAHMGALFGVMCLDSLLNEGRGPPLSF